MSEVNSTMLKARYQFYKKHPEIAPNMANDDLISNWAEENVQSLELPYTWDLASRALDGSLAKNTARVQVEPPDSEPAVPAAKQPQQNLKDMSVEQLRKIVKSQRVDFRPQLPATYTAERIRTMPAAELRQLQTRYSSAVLNARLRGEQ